MNSCRDFCLTRVKAGDEVRHSFDDLPPLNQDALSLCFSGGKRWANCLFRTFYLAAPLEPDRCPEDERVHASCRERRGRSLPLETHVQLTIHQRSQSKKSSAASLALLELRVETTALREYGTTLFFFSVYIMGLRASK